MTKATSSLLRHGAIKGIAAVLCCIFLLLSPASGIIVYYIGEAGMYTQSEEEVKEQLYRRVGYDVTYDALYRIYEYYSFSTPEQFAAVEAGINDERLGELLNEHNIFLTLCDKEGNVIATTYDGRALALEGKVELTLFEETQGEIGRVMHFHIAEQLTEEGTIYQIARYLPRVYALRWWAAALFTVSVLATLALLILLMLAAGRHAGEPMPRPSRFDRLPTDVMLILYAGLAVVWIALIGELSFDPHPLIYLLTVLLLIPSLPLLLLFFMSMATRCKCHTLLRNTVIFRVLHFIRQRILSPVVGLLRRLPLIPKVAFGLGGVALVELIVLLIFGRSFWLLLLWLLETVILSLVVIYIALSMRRLQAGSQALAAGNLKHQIDESELTGEFRLHAEHLNRIGESMEREIEERMRSERFRTELITNVSHDVKTPLTSIISYIDLLKAEPQASEAARDYIQIIDRQSTRLKKLMEDLIEVSKATTGHIAMQIAPCRLNVMLSQALGEYQERMRAAELLPVLHLAEPSPVIMADGRLLWRVFDNLLSNALKYAMPGTRVYLDVKAEGDEAVLLFRNVSRNELDVTSDELLERFVRGDRSRHTEGSGLGLPIAHSLVERMGGKLSLEVDGDLFKVMLRFPLAAEAAEQQQHSAEP